jgi:hypothetical protein
MTTIRNFEQRDGQSGVDTIRQQSRNGLSQMVEMNKAHVESMAEPVSIKQPEQETSNPKLDSDLAKGRQTIGNLSVPKRKFKPT